MENKEFQTLIVSLFLHGLLAWLLWHWPPPDLRPPDKPIEIEIEDRTKSRRMVEDTSIPKPEDLARKLHEQAENLSKLNQRVKEQMVARDLKGITSNRGRGDSPSLNRPAQRSTRPNLSDLRPPELVERMTGGMDPSRPTPQRDVNAPGSAGIGRFSTIGHSTLGQRIPNVKEGAFNLLNSDQLTYYSFYYRMNEAIANRWVSRVTNYVQMLTPLMIQQLARSPNVTVVDIVLDRKGKFIRANLLKSSGDANLDRAAIEPFKEAAPFENPPPEMADKDGQIHIVYQFYVIFEG